MKHAKHLQQSKKPVKAVVIDFNRATRKGNSVPVEKRKHNPKFELGQPLGRNF